MDPGDRLRQLRAQLGISTREVAELSKRVALSEGNTEFLVSSPWLTQIEHKRTIPSFFKLFSLACIYGVSYSHLLSLYGVDSQKILTYHASMPVSTTHLIQQEPLNAEAPIEVPIAFDPQLDLNQTNLLSRMIDTWGKIPIELIQGLDFRRRLYGFVGLKDYTLYPLIRPGAFVEIDPKFNKPDRRTARTEFDRPIYFIDLRKDYACGWCELADNKLLLLAHPFSPCPTRIFSYPGSAEIVGQVIGVAMRLNPSQERWTPNPRDDRSQAIR